jgi:hypothetical protein
VSEKYLVESQAQWDSGWRLVLRGSEKGWLDLDGNNSHLMSSARREKNVSYGCDVSYGYYASSALRRYCQHGHSTCWGT